MSGFFEDRTSDGSQIADGTTPPDAGLREQERDDTPAEGSPDRVAGKAPGPGDVLYGGGNVTTMPYSAEPFRPEEHAADPVPDREHPSGMDGRGHGIETIVPSADARAEHSAGTIEQHEPVHVEPQHGGGVLSDPVDTVPAGRGGADSGAVDAVRVEGSGSPGVEANSQNDIAGVGPRGSADPDISSGADGSQTGVRQDVGRPVLSEQVQGIVVQMRADLQTGRAPASLAREVLIERLTEAGLPTDGVDGLLERVRAGDAPTDIGEAQPGAGH